MSATRRDRLAAIGALHTAWVAKNLSRASAAFDPSFRPAGSDYNLHHVDVDADGAEQDAYVNEALNILAADGCVSEGRRKSSQTRRARAADGLVEVLTRADGLDVKAWNAANPTHLKGPDGKWADVPSVGMDTPGPVAPLGAARVGKTSRSTVEAGDFRGLAKVGGRLGHNEGGVYQAGDGSKWYIKSQRSDSHAHNEALAIVLYNEGLVHKSPQVVVGTGAPGLREGPQTASAWEDLRMPPEPGEPGYERFREGVQFDWGMDAWLGNWDVAGAGGRTNIEVWSHSSRKLPAPVRVEAGGAMLYSGTGRAKGGAFGESVVEWDTLQDPAINPSAARLFAGMSDLDKAESAERLRKIGPERVRSLVAEHGMPESLAELLLARRKDLLARAEQVRLDHERLARPTLPGEALEGRLALEAAPLRLPEYDMTYNDAGRIDLTVYDLVNRGGSGTGWAPDKLANLSKLLRYYRGGLWRQMGAYARDRTGDAPSSVTITGEDGQKERLHLDVELARLSEAFDKSRLTHPVRVYRGVEDPRAVFGDAWLPDRSMVGAEWSETSPTSTSVDPEVAAIFAGDHVILRIHAPAGIGAIQLSDWPTESKRTSEAELALQPWLRYRVVADSVDVVDLPRPAGSDQRQQKGTRPADRTPMRVRVLDMEVRELAEDEEPDSNPGRPADDHELSGRGRVPGHARSRQRSEAGGRADCGPHRRSAATNSPHIAAAGLAVVAVDTGRVLMLQRALDDGDPAAGMWEFPGGGLEHGEDPLGAAKREWSEETGCELPPGKLTGSWHSGIYCGYVWQVNDESCVALFDGRDDVTNPDDPDGDAIEALAWWDSAQLTGSNPALRDELRQSVPKVLAALAGLTPVGLGRHATPRHTRFDPAQPRDKHGQWTDAPQTYFRVMAANRLHELLDPKSQVSKAWHKEGLDRNGVSGTKTLEELAEYLADRGSGIPYGEPGWVLVEFEGDTSGDEPLDMDYGEVLAYPTKIVSAEPIPDEFFDMIGEAYDKRLALAQRALRRDATFESLHPRNPNTGHFIDKKAIEGLSRWLTKTYGKVGSPRLHPGKWGVRVSFVYKEAPVSVDLSYLDLASFAIGVGAGGLGAAAKTATVAGKVNRAVKLAQAAKAAKVAATGAGVAASVSPSRSAASAAASIVDCLVGGGYTPQQRQARAEWLKASRGGAAGFTRGEWRQLRRGDYYNIRWPKGAKVGGKGVGGRWMDVGAALEDWMNGLGSKDPLESFDQRELKAAAKALGVNPPARATKPQLKELLRVKATADVRAQRDENLAKAGTGRGTPYTPPVGTRRELPGGYMVREPSPGAKGEAGRWSNDGTKWIPDEKTPNDRWAVYRSGGELVGHVSTPSEARALLDKTRQSGSQPAGTRVLLDSGSHAEWDGAVWQVHVGPQQAGGRTFDSRLVGSASTLDEARALVAKALAALPETVEARKVFGDGPVRPEYMGPKMTIKPTGRKLTAKERIEEAVASGRITVETATRLLKGKLTEPESLNQRAVLSLARALATVADIDELAKTGDADRLRAHLRRQNTSTLRNAARVLGVKVGDSKDHDVVVDAIAAHAMKEAATPTAEAVKPTKKAVRPPTKKVSEPASQQVAAHRSPSLDLREAYWVGRGASSTDYVSLASIRETLAIRGYTKVEQDAAIRESAARPGVELTSVDESPTGASQADRDAAVEIDGHGKHFMRLVPLASESQYWHPVEWAPASRQARIDLARGFADTLGAVAGMLEKGASYEIMQHQLKTLQALRRLEGAPSLEPLRKALEAQHSRAAIRRAIAAAEADIGLERVGLKGGFDIDRHAPLVPPAPPKGTPIVSVTPGYYHMEPDGSRVLLDPEKVDTKQRAVAKSTPSWPVNPADVRARLLATEPELRRKLLDTLNLDQGPARALARDLGVKGASRLTAPQALDKIVSYFADATPARVAGFPTYKPPSGLTAEERRRAAELVRRDPQLFASIQDRLGSISNSGNLTDDDAAWLQSIHDREPAFVNHLAQTMQIDRQLRRDAKAAGKTLTVYKKEKAAQLRTLLADKPVAVRMRDEAALRDVLDGGRFKTSFDTGVRRAPGLKVDVDKRRLGEEINGVPAHTPPEKRPVYGYVAVAGIEPALFEGVKTPGIVSREGQQDVLSVYGKVQVVLKPEVRSRTTVTVGDSLDGVALVKPSPIDDPSAESVGLSDPTSPGFTRTGYVEAQVHQGVTRDDIAEVVFAEEPSGETVARLASNGIPWRVLAIGDQTRAWRGLSRGGDHWKDQPRDPGGEDGGQWVKSPMPDAAVIERFGEWADEVQLAGSRAVSAHDRGYVLLGGDVQDDRRTVLTSLSPDDAHSLADLLDEMVAAFDEHDEDEDEDDLARFDADTSVSALKDGTYTRYLPTRYDDRRIEVMFRGGEHEGDGEAFDRDGAETLAEALRDMAAEAESAASEREREEWEREEWEREEREREEREREEREEWEEREREEREREEREREEREREAAEAWWEDIVLRSGRSGVFSNGNVISMLDQDTVEVQGTLSGTTAWASIRAGDLPALVKAIRDLHAKGADTEQYEDDDEDDELIEPGLVEEVEIGPTRGLQLLEDGQLWLVDERYQLAPIARETALVVADQLEALHAQWQAAPKPQPSRSAALMAVSIVDALVGRYTRGQERARREWLRAARGGSAHWMQQPRDSGGEGGGRWIADSMAGHAARVARLTQAHQGGIVDRELLSGGRMADTYRVTFSDGTQGILKTAKLNREFPMLKPELQTHNEVLAPKVGAAVGIPTMPAAVRIDPVTVLKEFGEGEPWAEADADLIAELRADNAEDVRRLGLFDVLTHNGDRHSYNVLVHGEPGGSKTIVPIDHGNLFGPVTRDEYREAIPLPEYSNPEMTNPFTRTGKKDRNGLPELEYLADGVSVAELERIEEALKGLRPDFDDAGLTHQHKAMMERLAIMLVNARYRASRQQGRSNEGLLDHPRGLGRRVGQGDLRWPGLAVQQPGSRVDGDTEAGAGLDRRAGARLLRRLVQRLGDGSRVLERGPQAVARRPRVKAPRPFAGVPFKQNDEGQWIDRYGQFADLPGLPKPAKPAAAKGQPPDTPPDTPHVVRWTDPQTGQVHIGTVVKSNTSSTYVKWEGGRTERIPRSDNSIQHPPLKTKGAADEPLRPDGPGALGQVPAGRVPGDDRPGGVLPGVGRPDRRPDSGSAAGPGGDGAAGRDVAGADRPAQLGASDGAGAGAAGGAADGRGGRSAPGRVGGGDAATAVAGPVFQPRGKGDLAPSGEMARIDANLEALRTLRRIEAEGRPATEDEQARLARWSGWGAAKNIFADFPDDPAADRAKWQRKYGARNRELRELLGTKYDAAARTVRNAHYTDPAYVDAIWNTLRDLGFNGGRVLEPGSGSGTFMGYAPDGTHMVGVELDPTTAGISAALYPNHTVLNDSFADALRDWDGKFDAAVGNVPFADTALVDKKHNPGRRHSMHNHFIIKSLHLTKPGGMVAMLTSRYTMDSAGRASREKMAELADLVGAVRLPSGAHSKAAGTDVVTDLLIFRRRESDAAPRGLSFVDTRTVDVDGTEVGINEAFVDHPELVLGKLGLGGMRAREDLTVAGPKAAAPALRKALADITKRAKADKLTMTGGKAEAHRIEIASPQDRQPDGFLRPKPDGTFTVSIDGFEQPHDVPKAQADELRALLRIRDVEHALLDEESSHTQETDRMRGLRAELNTAYDEYLAKYGAINRFTSRRTGKQRLNEETGEMEDIYARQYQSPGGFRSDPSSASVRGLEDYDPLRNTTRKASIFRQRAIAPRTPKTRADNPTEALNIAMDQHGQDEVNLAAVAKLLDVDEAKARQMLGDLVYADPGKDGKLVPAVAYLSGNVRDKLDAARLAAADNDTYTANVAALRAVLPPDIRPEDIVAHLGASWIDEKHVQQFVRGLLGDNDAKVEHALGAQWKVTPGASRHKSSVAATSRWGTNRKNAYEIVETLLTQKPVKVYDEVGDPPKRVLNQAKTEAAQAKATEVAERFEQWVWEDPARAAELATAYNRMFNSLVLRNYDAEGERLTLPGMSERFNPHPHVKAAVARIIAEPAVGLWHEVGAGKTSEMVIGSHELRRLGLVNKPAIVVPNHMLEQFSREYLEIYPQAKLLAASTADLEKNKRREFVARAATGDWDAVILTQSAFESIPVSKQTETGYLEREVAQLRAKLVEARAKDQADNSGSRRKKDGFAVSQIEKAIQNAEERVKANREKAGNDDASLTFERTGIDYLFVDEAHLYKNLRRASNIEGQGIVGNGKTTDLHTKIEYLRGGNPNGRVVTLATATPIANTMGEAHTMMRYLRPDVLRSMGIEDFDSFVTNFGTVVTGVEPAPEGGLRTKSRIAKFVNVPELLRPWWVAGDVKTGEDLEHITKPPRLRPNPDADGKPVPEVVVVPTSDELKGKVAELGERANAIRKRGGRAEKGEDNMLNITNEGRAAALDLRLVGMDTNEPTKLDFAADKIAEIWAETKGNRYPAGTDAGSPEHPTPGALQIVFADLGTPGGGAASPGGVLKGKPIPGTDAREVPVLRGGTESLTIFTGDDNKLGTLRKTPDGKQWVAIDNKRFTVAVVTSKADAVNALIAAAPRQKKTGMKTDKGFSVYDELRNKLVERGMPREKIRFIHEAKSDADKARLFADARDGNISVLVGSTGKMGVGTNVQHRAVALHHLDVPWRPADVQQREGRIIRQKNQNPEVRVLRYVTEGSFDAYNWGVVARKAKFINQMMRGKLDSREMDDIGDMALSADVAAALAAGNPTLIKHAEAQAELNLLERRHATYQNNQKNLPQRIEAAEKKIADSQIALATTNTAIKRRDTAKAEQGDKFAMTVGGTTYDKHGDATDALREQLRKSPWWRFVAVGELGGSTIKAMREHDGVRLELADVPGGSMLLTPAELDKADLITRLSNRLKDLDQVRARHKANIDAEEQNIEVAQSQLGQPFKDMAKLKGARARFAELDDQIKAQAAEADARRDKKLFPPRVDVAAELTALFGETQRAEDADASKGLIELVGARTLLDALSFTRTVSEALGLPPPPDKDEAGLARSWLAAFDHRSPSIEDIARWARATGADTHPGGEQLHHYWTKDPEGLAKWATLPEGRWTALYGHLVKHMSAAKARRVASAWFLEVIGYAAGSDKNRVASGKPPRGKLVGPG